MKLAVIGSRTWSKQSLLEKTLAKFILRAYEQGNAVTELLIPPHWIGMLSSCWYEQQSPNIVVSADFVPRCNSLLAFVMPEKCIACSGYGNASVLENGEYGYAECPHCAGRGWIPTCGTADTLRKAKAAGKAQAEEEGKMIEW